MYARFVSIRHFFSTQRQIFFLLFLASFYKNETRDSDTATAGLSVTMIAVAT